MRWIKRKTLALLNRRKPYVQAHRGNCTACPENTLAAFSRAFEDGADIIETDVHVTADGEFVCIHDETVDRTTDGTGRVADMTLEEIKKLRASNGYQAFANERVPTLAEALEALPPNRGISIELKSKRFMKLETCKRLADEIERHNADERAVVISFQMPFLKTLRKVAPNIPIGHITHAKPYPRNDVELLGPLWPYVLLYPFYVRWAHRRGKLVIPLDDRPNTRLWLYRAIGVDIISTNNPAATVRALGRA
jgi:glycerophosphoryl diester phosphodiesterase